METEKMEVGCPLEEGGGKRGWWGRVKTEKMGGRGSCPLEKETNQVIRNPSPCLSTKIIQSGTQPKERKTTLRVEIYQYFYCMF